MKKTFIYPAAYNWLKKKDIMEYVPFSVLAPWYFLRIEDHFDIPPTEFNNKTISLVAFARRQDNDEFACFSKEENGLNDVVYIVQGWTPDGFQVVDEFNTSWTWLKAVIDDISESY